LKSHRLQPTEAIAIYAGLLHLVLGDLEQPACVDTTAPNWMRCGQEVAAGGRGGALITKKPPAPIKTWEEEAAAAVGASSRRRPCGQRRPPRRISSSSARPSDCRRPSGTGRGASCCAARRAARAVDVGGAWGTKMGPDHACDSKARTYVKPHNTHTTRAFHDKQLAPRALFLPSS
jgi:hypothetical protein